MCIERMQKRCARDAICSSTGLKAGGILRARIATDDIVSATAGIVRVVDSKLGMIENIEKLCAELEVAGFFDLKVFYQRHVEVQAAGIIQKISARIPKSQAPRRYKFRCISQERTKALNVVQGLRQSTNYIGIGFRNTQPAGYSGIIGE